MEIEPLMMISQYIRTGLPQEEAGVTSGTSVIRPKAHSVEVIQMATENAGSKQTQTVSFHPHAISNATYNFTIIYHVTVAHWHI